MLYDIEAITVNARKRAADTDKVRELASSIAEIGLINPITITLAGDLVAGLHRLEACKSLGFRRIEVSTLDIAPLLQELAEIDENLIRNNLNALQEGRQLARRKAIYEELHPETKAGTAGANARWNDATETVSVASFAEDTAKKTGKTDRTIRNKTRIGEALEEVADQLIGTPIEDSQKDLLALASMTPDQRDQVIEKIHDGAETVADAAKKVREETRAANPPAVLPDACVIEHGESTEHLPDRSFHAIITDPPYGISHYGGVTKVGDRIVTANFDGDEEAWDTMNPADFLNQLDSWAEEWERLLKPGGSVIAFCDRALVSHLWDALRRVGLKPKQIIVWVKVNPNPASLARHNLISATEFMVWAVAPGEKYTFNEVEGWNRHNVITTPIIGGYERTDHTTQKPLAVMTKLVALVTNPGDLVLDPFGGSGSTADAAIRLGRRAHLIEKEAKHVHVAQERLAALTTHEVAA